MSPPSTREDSRDGTLTRTARGSSYALVCIFWGTVAIGGLLQGKPETLVSHNGVSMTSTIRALSPRQTAAPNGRIDPMALKTQGLGTARGFLRTVP